jgi:hypothetical protein
VNFGYFGINSALLYDNAITRGDRKMNDDKAKDNQYKLNTVNGIAADQSIGQAIEDCLTLASLGCPLYIGTVKGRVVTVIADGAHC